MSRGFGATFGIATTDKITPALTSWSSQRSWFIRQNRNADGGTGYGVMWIHGLSSTGNDTQLINTNPDFAGTYGFIAEFATTRGYWTWTRPSTSVWTSIGIKYDFGATTNDPTVYDDTTILTVGSGLTERSTPVGAAVDNTGDTHLIGNWDNNNFNWDGMLAEFAVWDALLDDSEFQAMANGYSPQFIRPASLIEYVPLLRDVVSRKLAGPTVNGTAVQPHPRIIMPIGRYRRRYFQAPGEVALIQPHVALQETRRMIAY